MEGGPVIQDIQYLHHMFLQPHSQGISSSRPMFLHLSFMILVCKLAVLVEHTILQP